MVCRDGAAAPYVDLNFCLLMFSRCSAGDALTREMCLICFVTLLVASVTSLGIFYLQCLMFMYYFAIFKMHT